MRLGLIHANVGGAAGGGGGVRQMLQLAQGLTELGHDVVVAAHGLELTQELRERSPGVEFRGVTERIDGRRQARLDRVRWFYRDMHEVAELLQDVDAVNPHEWPAIHAGAVAARRRSLPLVWTRNDPTIYESCVGGGPRALPRRLLYLRERADARLADAITVLNTASLEGVRNAYGREAAIVRSGPDPFFGERPTSRADARRDLGVPADTFLVLAVGVMLGHRRFEDLIGAAALVRDDVPLLIRIVGSDHLNPSYADFLRAEIRRTHTEHRVELVVDTLSDEQLRDHYAAADVFAHTHDGQTYGLAPLEALVAGTPVLLSTGAGVHEILAGRSGVTTIRPGEVPGLAAAIEGARSGPAPDVATTARWIGEELGRRRYAERMVELMSGRLTAARSGGRRRSEGDSA